MELDQKVDLIFYLVGQNSKFLKLPHAMLHPNFELASYVSQNPKETSVWVT